MSDPFWGFMAGLIVSGVVCIVVVLVVASWS